MQDRLQLSVSVFLCVSATFYSVKVYPPIDNYTHTDTHAHTQTIIRSQRPPSPLPRAPGGPSFIANNLHSLHYSWDAYTKPQNHTINHAQTQVERKCDRRDKEVVFTPQATTILISLGY